ncbi:MAG: hypothetical protein AB1483_00360 [Candidatus Zixiibacteriota bacterium]
MECNDVSRPPGEECKPKEKTRLKGTDAPDETWTIADLPADRSGTPDTSTTPETGVGELTVEAEARMETEINTTSWGSAKPKRITIKGKISRDEDDNGTSDAN